MSDEYYYYILKNPSIIGGVDSKTPVISKINKSMFGQMSLNLTDIKQAEGSFESIFELMFAIKCK